MQGKVWHWLDPHPAMSSEPTGAACGEPAATAFGCPINDRETNDPGDVRVPPTTSCTQSLQMRPQANFTSECGHSRDLGCTGEAHVSYMSSKSSVFGFVSENPSVVSFLDSEGAADLLRAVPVTKVSAQWYAVFRSHHGTDKHFNMSKPVKEIDDFFSHDWSSGRWQKVATMLFTYNLYPAFGVSSATAATVAVAQSDLFAILPKLPSRERMVGGEVKQFTPGVWCTLLCPIAFIFTLLMWQNVRSFVGMTPKLLFVDKCCINQIDATVKRKSILSIPGVLHRSQRLVICWTPRYFTRLWCVFEIATWKALQKPVHSIMLTPSAKASFVFTLLGGLTCFYVSVAIQALVIAALETSSIWWLTYLLQFAALCGLVKSTKHLVATWSLLPKQLESFQVRDCDCFCCSNNHVMPDTGLRIECDRRFIYAKLREWAIASGHVEGDPDEDRGTVLSLFNKFVSEEFSPWVLKLAGATQFPYQEALVVCCPMLWSAFDHLASDGSMPMIQLIRLAVCEFGVNWCFALPITLKLGILFAARLDRDASQRPWIHWIRAPALLLVLSTSGACMWMPLSEINKRSTGIFPVLAWDMLLLVLTVYLFRLVPFTLFRRR